MTDTGLNMRLAVFPEKKCSLLLALNSSLFGHSLTVNEKYVSFYLRIKTFGPFSFT